MNTVQLSPVQPALDQGSTSGGALYNITPNAKHAIIIRVPSIMVNIAP